MITYQYRKGRIVTITWKHGGEICKVLARPGQLVYDTITNSIYYLKEDEYVLQNDLWIKQADYLVAQENTKPIPGILVNAIHLIPSTPREKALRRRGILKAPNNIIKGEVNEILVSKKGLIQKLVRILDIAGDKEFPLYILSNGEIISRGTLKSLYRKANGEEESTYDETKTRLYKTLQNSN